VPLPESRHADIEQGKQMPDLILKAHPSMSFSDKETRERFVKFVAKMLSTEGPFEPFKVNANVTDLEWSVDKTNDWWVFFDADDWARVRIKQRYDVGAALTSLGGWIAYRWRMTVDTPEPAMPR
jgi:hypothetical protein